MENGRWSVGVSTFKKEWVKQQICATPKKHGRLVRVLLAQCSGQMLSVLIFLSMQRRLSHINQFNSFFHIRYICASAVQLLSHLILWCRIQRAVTQSHIFGVPKLQQFRSNQRHFGVDESHDATNGMGRGGLIRSRGETGSHEEWKDHDGGPWSSNVRLSCKAMAPKHAKMQNRHKTTHI